MAEGVIAGAVLGGVNTAVQANQQKIAAQKQRDALADAEKAQQKVLDDQKKADAERVAKEDAITQNAFAKVASTRKGVSGANLPGAVTDQAIGVVSGPSTAGKTLVGS